MNRIIETCKSGSDHSFPDSAASKPPQNFLYQPPSLSSLWMWQKQRLTLTIEIPNAHLVVLSSGCVLQSMSIQVFEQNPKLKKKNFFICNLLYSQEWTKFSTNIFLHPNQNLWCLGEGKDFITIMSIQVRCILECLASCVFHLKVLSHWLHLNGLPPVCVFMWLCKLAEVAQA